VNSSYPRETTSESEIKRRFILSALKFLDIGLVTESFGVASVWMIYTGKSISLATLLAVKVKVSDCAVFAVALLASHAMFWLCGLYQSRRLSTGSAESIDVLKAVTLATASLALIAVLFSVKLITLSFLTLFFLLCLFSVTTSRLILRYTLASIRRRGRNLHHMLILGTNSRAIEFARRIEASPERGYRLLGFVDDDWAKMDQFDATGFKLACNCAGLAEFLRHNVVDEVAIYLPLRSYYELAARMAVLCEMHGIILRFDSAIFDLKIARSHADVFDGDAQITARSGGSTGWPFFLKRTIDVISSLVLLILLSPLLLVVAILIKLTSPGPIFFGQERVGLNKRKFTIHKFRTMILNAERVQETLAHLNEMSGPVFKIRNDPRVTNIGRILRKTSIDELPQLINVLKGDMSLVGPRAMSVRDYQHFSEDWQRRRFSVPPGITCLWQVNGRNLIPFEQWMELDMQYIDEWSLWLDLKILVRTIPAVLRGSGAA
jgi:exopolysaccharide biosynthesis polyprenyl glycosylphosphotransferase